MSLTLSDAWAIARHDAHDQAAMVRDGTVPADTLVEAAILRIEQADTMGGAREGADYLPELLEAVLP